jgi:hypothetical protein
VTAPLGTGIIRAYHLFQLPALSPATSRIAERHGSKTNRMRTSLRPRDPGRSSFRFAIFELVMVLTTGPG